REGPDSPDRHHRSRRSPTRDLERGQLCRERLERRAQALPVDLACVGRDSRGVPADAGRRGSRRQTVSGDARRRGRVFASVPLPAVMGQVAARMGEGMVRSGRVYVLRNSAFAPTYSPVERRTINIAARAIDSLITTQGFGDRYRIY